MRTALTCLAWLCAAGVGVAQTTPYFATVTADNVNLRSGTSFDMEETGPLARGEVVVVVREHGEQWLAVEPPRGQLSWVRKIALEELGGGGPLTLPRNAVIRGDPDVEVAMGRPGRASPLGVRKDRVPDGTVVQVIGNTYSESVGNAQIGWVPIVPVKGECRYLPRSAVQISRGRATAASYTVNTPLKAPAPAEPEATPAPGLTRPATPAGEAATGRGKPAGWPSEPLWLQAEEASRLQEYERAERLYLQLASDQNRPGGDVELANLCYERVHAVLEKQRAVGRPAKGMATPVGRGDSEGAGRPAAKSREPQWTSAGTVRETGFGSGAGAKYSFRSASTGKVIAYLEAGPGVDLGQWREAEVELYATVRAAQDSGGPPTLTVTRVKRAGSRRD